MHCVAWLDNGGSLGCPWKGRESDRAAHEDDCAVIDRTVEIEELAIKNRSDRAFSLGRYKGQVALHKAEMADLRSSHAEHILVLEDGNLLDACLLGHADLVSMFLDKEMSVTFECRLASRVVQGKFAGGMSPMPWRALLRILSVFPFHGCPTMGV